PCSGRQHLPSFPTRRSSDLERQTDRRIDSARATAGPPLLSTFRSRRQSCAWCFGGLLNGGSCSRPRSARYRLAYISLAEPLVLRSEEHTSELQSQSNLVCRR